MSEYNDIIIDMIFDYIKDKNLYNYANDDRFKNVYFEEFTNMLGNQAINITLVDDDLREHTFTITCNETYVSAPMIDCEGE